MVEEAKTQGSRIGEDMKKFFLINVAALSFLVGTTLARADVAIKRNDNHSLSRSIVLKSLAGGIDDR